MDTHRIGRRVIVSGRVQGVWFRGSMQAVAESLGVKGWVRNLSDGRVEAVLEGEETSVLACVEWVAEGPRHARVDTIDVTEEQPQGLSGFVVR
jgi:acylphosphatase